MKIDEITTQRFADGEDSFPYAGNTKPACYPLPEDGWVEVRENIFRHPLVGDGEIRLRVHRDYDALFLYGERDAYFYLDR